MPFTICVDFLAFPDNHPMPPSFFLPGRPGYKFDYLRPGPGVRVPFVNMTGAAPRAELALQFPKEGVKILFPAPTTNVTMRIGCFSASIDVEFIGTGGAVVLSTAVTAKLFTNKNFLLRRRAMLVTLKGGNNEGALVKICGTF
jgi:hypothetical protein